MATTLPASSRRAHFVAGALALSAAFAGCGTTKTQLATEQLLVSDAVDRAVSDIDFRDLAGQKVYFDTRYIQNVKSVGFVNSEYIISSLRQQMFAANCHLQDSADTADYIVEARVGALGTDAHDVVYGMPANNALSSAAQVVPNAPTMPAIPEIALAKRNDQTGAAKIAVFAFHKATKSPVWQSGISQARSHAKDTWLFGAGPFQRGTIYSGTQFAGGELGVPLVEGADEPEVAPAIPYHGKVRFADHLEGDAENATEAEKRTSFDGPPLPETGEKKEPPSPPAPETK